MNYFRTKIKEALSQHEDEIRKGDIYWFLKDIRNTLYSSTNPNLQDIDLVHKLIQVVKKQPNIIDNGKDLNDFADIELLALVKLNPCLQPYWNTLVFFKNNYFYIFDEKDFKEWISKNNGKDVEDYFESLTPGDQKLTREEFISQVIEEHMYHLGYEGIEANGIDGINEYKELFRCLLDNKNNLSIKYILEYL